MAWAPWAPESFARARAEGRVILVNVVAEWCHWCHVMDAQTYGDPRVQELLRAHFVAIRVDSDARPDVAERYAAWGWPATAVLTPDGRPVLELRGYQRADGFVTLLQELARDQEAGKLTGRRVAPEPAPAADVELVALYHRLQARLDGYYDPEGGGWGRSAQKYPLADAVEHALARAGASPGSPWRARALQTLEGTAALIDPVWGGVYQYSVGGVWTRPHFEKIARIQAGALRNFAQAYAWTGDEVWLKRADRVVDYLESFLRDPSGGFFTSQDADLRKPDGELVPGARYYALDDAGRRALGIPRVDRAIYADLNGELIHALAVRYAARPEDPRPLELAQAAAARLLRAHRDPRGLLRHAADDAGSVRYLRDQVSVGLALVHLYRVTGEPSWLDAARDLADATLATFQDPKLGGFFANTPDPAAHGALARPQRPLADNARAARFLLALHEQLDHGEGRDTPYRRGAEGALRAVAVPAKVAPEGRMIDGLVLALRDATRPTAWLTVSGDRSDPRTRALHRAALAAFAHRVVVEVAAPGTRYPDTGAPAVFLCTATACSTPIRDPAKLPAKGATFLATNVRPPP